MTELLKRTIAARRERQTLGRFLKALHTAEDDAGLNGGTRWPLVFIHDNQSLQVKRVTISTAGYWVELG